MVDLKVRVLMRDGLPYLRAAENPHTDMADLRASNPNSLPAAIDPALAEPVKMLNYLEELLSRVSRSGDPPREQLCPSYSRVCQFDERRRRRQKIVTEEPSVCESG